MVARIPFFGFFLPRSFRNWNILKNFFQQKLKKAVNYNNSKMPSKKTNDVAMFTKPFDRPNPNVLNENYKMHSEKIQEINKNRLSSADKMGLEEKTVKARVHSIKRFKKDISERRDFKISNPDFLNA